MVGFGVSGGTQVLAIAVPFAMTRICTPVCGLEIPIIRNMIFEPYQGL